MQWDAALLESGFAPEDPKGFSGRLYSMLKDTLGLEASLEVPKDTEDVAETELQPVSKGRVCYIVT